MTLPKPQEIAVVLRVKAQSKSFTSEEQSWLLSAARMIEFLERQQYHYRPQPALLISHGLEKIDAVEPVLVPIDWDFTNKTLAFAVGSNQEVTTDKLYIY